VLYPRLLEKALVVSFYALAIFLNAKSGHLIFLSWQPWFRMDFMQKKPARPPRAPSQSFRAEGRELSLFPSVCMCVCVCSLVWQRESERERESAPAFSCFRSPGEWWCACAKVLARRPVSKSKGVCRVSDLSSNCHSRDSKYDLGWVDVGIFFWFVPNIFMILIFPLKNSAQMNLNPKMYFFKFW